MSSTELQPSIDLVRKVALIGQTKWLLPEYKGGYLTNIGFNVEWEVVSALEARCEASAWLESKLEFSGIPGTMTFLHESKASTIGAADVKVTRYIPGDWEQKVTRTYVKAKEVNKAIIAQDLRKLEKLLREGCGESEEFGELVVLTLGILHDLPQNKEASLTPESLTPEFVDRMNECVGKTQYVHWKARKFRPKRSSIIPVHASLVRWTESLSEWVGAFADYMKVGKKIVDSDYKRHDLMPQFNFTEAKWWEAYAKMMTSAQQFIEAWRRLADSDKETFELLPIRAAMQLRADETNQAMHI